MANIKEAISSVKNISDPFDLSKHLATTQSFVDVTQEPFLWTFSFENVRSLLFPLCFCHYMMFATVIFLVMNLFMLNNNTQSY